MDETTDLETAWAQMVPAADRLAKAAATLKKVARALSRAEGYESLKKVEKALAQLEQADAVPPALAAQARAAAEPVREWLQAEWVTRAARFGDDLAAYFEDRGVPLKGAAPRLEAPPLSLRLDGAADRVDLLYAGEPLKEKLPMAPDRVFREREAALTRLRRAQTDPGELADRLLDAYKAVPKDKAGRARLPQLHFQLFIDGQTGPAKASLARNKIKEYPRVQFAWDLAQLLGAPHFLVRGARTLELVAASPSSAASRSTSVLVVTADGSATSFGALKVSS